MGDLAHLMPVIHPYVVAAEGKAHAFADQRATARLSDPAKLLAMTAIDLLYGDAAPAKEILASFEPAMTKEPLFGLQPGPLPQGTPLEGRRNSEGDRTARQFAVARFALCVENCRRDWNATTGRGLASA
jgi:hypothetical protein